MLNVDSADVLTSASQPTTLACEVTGTPAPEVTWTRQDQPLDKERCRQLSDGSLFLSDTDLQDEGTYVVQAINSVGQAQASVHVKVVISMPPQREC